MVEKSSKLEQNHREMFFSLALLSFEDTYINILSIDKERDDVLRRDVSISGLDISNISKKCRRRSDREEDEDMFVTYVW